MYVARAPLAMLFARGFAFIVDEEIFKGVAAFLLHIQD